MKLVSKYSIYISYLAAALGLYEAAFVIIGGAITLAILSTTETETKTP